MLKKCLIKSSDTCHKDPQAEGMFAVSNPLEVSIKVDALSRKLDQLMAAGFAPISAPTIIPEYIYIYTTEKINNGKSK
jgi:hypothetical protein